MKGTHVARVSPTRPPGTGCPPDRRTHSPGTGTSRKGRADSGYSTVEAVLLLPVLVAITLTVIQFALLWHARTLAQSTARVGAQAARAYTATDEDGLRQARTYLDTVDPALLAGADIEVSRTRTSVEVQVRARVLAVPGLPFTLAVDERSSGPLERFVAADAPR